MFAFFSALLLLALLTFGAVQPFAYFMVGIVWLIALAVLVTKDIATHRRLSVPVMVYVVAVVLAFLVDYKLALSALALGWGWLATQRAPLRTLSFLRFLVVVGVLEAILGLIQYFVAPGWIFGYHNRFYATSGTLINHNHFAGLLEMMVPAAIGFAFAGLMKGRDVARVYSYVLLGTLMTVAIIFSTSRMGLFSALATLLFLGATLQFKSARGGAAVAFVALGLVVAGGLWIGVDVVVQRFALLTGQDALLQEGRVLVYRDTLEMIAEHPLGIGVGAYRDFFRQYQTFRPDLLMDHAHNDYLETAAEWGVVPAAVFWIAIFALFVRAWRSLLRTGSPERATILIAATGAIFSILLHSLVDFNLQIPSNAMLFFAFVGIAAQVSTRTPFPSVEATEGSKAQRR